MARLVVLAGLPGSGKSTVARALARRTGALWLRIDSVEAAMRRSHMVTPDLADGGYAAARAVAGNALEQGFDVVADCVNPVAHTRQDWRAVAVAREVPHWGIEFRCPDPVEHRRRVESRQAEFPGQRLPSWEEVLARRYEPWDGAIVIDTALLSPEAAAERIIGSTGWVYG